MADFISDAILRDVYLPNEQVPSSTEISINYKINPATVQKGIKMLTDDGVLYKKRGVGMFVSPNGKDILLNRRKQNFKSEYVDKMKEEANRLGISDDEIVQMLKEE